MTIAQVAAIAQHLPHGMHQGQNAGFQLKAGMMPEKRGHRAAAAGRSHAGPVDSSSRIAGPQRAAQGPHKSRSRAALELVVQGPGVLCKRAQFELVADLEVNALTSTGKPLTYLHLRRNAGSLSCGGQGTL